MSRQYLLAQARSLSPEERKLLALELYGDLRSDVGADEQRAWENAWRDELQRRALELKSGKVKAVPARDALIAVRARIDSHRS